MKNKKYFDFLNYSYYTEIVLMYFLIILYSMTKKNKFIILTIWWILCIASFIFFLLWDKFWNKPTNEIKITQNGVKEISKDAPDIVLLNQILQRANSRDDYKKCEGISIEDIKQNCIAQIKLRFSDIGLANTLNDCKNITGDNTLWTAKKRQDVCYLNLNNNTSKNYKETEEICNNIQNEDLKGLCFTQWKLKFWEK